MVVFVVDVSWIIIFIWFSIVRHGQFNIYMGPGHEGDNKNFIEMW